MPGVVRVEIDGYHEQLAPIDRQVDDRRVLIADQTEDAPFGLLALHVGVLLEVEKVVFHSGIDSKSNSGMVITCSMKC